MLGTITLAQGSLQKLSLSAIIQKYAKNPYGWSEPAILYLLAKLVSFGKVEAYSQGRPLEREDLILTLRQKDKYASLIIQPQAEYSPAELHKLKKIVEEMMGHPAHSTDAKALTKEFIEALTAQTGKLQQYLFKQEVFSFVTALESAIKQYKEFSGKPTSWFFTDFMAIEKELLQQKHGLVDPIISFMESPQAEIYKNIHSFIKENQLNLSYLDTEAVKAVQDALADQAIYIGSKLKDAKVNYEFLTDQRFRLLKTEQEKALKAMQPLYESLQVNAKDIQAHLSKVEEMYKRVTGMIGQATVIPAILTTRNQFMDVDYLDLLNEIAAYHSPPLEGKPSVKIVSAKSLKPRISKEIIATSADLDEYLKLLREAFMAELGKGNRIKV